MPCVMSIAPSATGAARSEFVSACDSSPPVLSLPEVLLDAAAELLSDDDELLSPQAVRAIPASKTASVIDIIFFIAYFFPFDQP